MAHLSVPPSSSAGAHTRIFDPPKALSNDQREAPKTSQVPSTQVGKPPKPAPIFVKPFTVPPVLRNKSHNAHAEEPH